MLNSCIFLFIACDKKKESAQKRAQGKEEIAITAIPSSGDNHVMFSINASTPNITVDWGEGVIETISAYGLGAEYNNFHLSHNYENDEPKTIKISGAKICYFGYEYGVITSLLFGNLQYMKELNCKGQKLSSINLTQLPNLNSADLSFNNLTTIDLRNNKHLKYLNVSVNNLSALNLSTNKELLNLLCSDNRLTTITATTLDNLQQVQCYNNQLSGDALNTLMATLPYVINASNWSRLMLIGNNPGASSCNATIAKDKWWHVDTITY